MDSDPFVAVISERLWASHFGMEVDPVGRTLILDDHAVTVIGVAGGGFVGVDRSRATDVWLPRAAAIPFAGFTRERLLSNESTNYVSLVALPASGTSPQAVETQVAQILGRLGEGASDHERYLADLRPMVFPGLHTIVPSRRRRVTISASSPESA